VTAAVVWLGFLLGLRHALEPDHVTAVAALASTSARTRQVARVAAAWGLGHALVLLAAGVVLAWTGARFPPAVGGVLELVVGAVLVWLGVDVLRRARRQRMANASASDSATSSSGAIAASSSGSAAFVARAFVVGGVHGVEGSGAVVLLALPTLRSAGGAAAYLGVFGLGSVIGMVACSFAVTLPLGVAARRFAASGRTLQLAIGVTSVAVGALIVGGYIRSIFT
jgi:hypothetical protein